MSKKFYVYGYVYPEGHHWVGEFCYIGKGQGKRLKWQHWFLDNYHLDNTFQMHNKFMQGLLKRYGELPMVILKRFAKEQDALDFEAERILEFGRRDLGTGRLCNLSNGH